VRILLRLQNYLLPLAVLLLGVALQLLQPYPVEFVRNIVFDQYNRWQPRVETNDLVVFVDIDEASLVSIGQFPWPRSVFAELVTNMHDHGSAAIAFDVLFTEPDRTAPSEILPVWQTLRRSADADTWANLQADIEAQISSPDDALARAIAEAPVVLATMVNDDVRSLPDPKAGIALRANNMGDTDTALDPMRRVPSSQFAIANRDVLQQSAVGLGAINARIDEDGIIRRAGLLYRAGQHVYPSLALETLRVAQGAGSIALRASDVRGEGAYTSGFGLSRLKVGQVIAPIEPDGSMRIYYAPSRSIPTLSAHDILRPGFDPQKLAGKIAFIGTSAAGLKDIRATPLNPATPGVEVHIQTVQQLIAGTFLRRPIWVQTLEGLATLFMGGVLIFMVQRFSLVPSILFLLASMSAAMAFSWYQFLSELRLVDPATPSLTAFVTFLTAAFLHFLETARERREVRNAFQYYLAPDMVEQIASNPEKLKLGGETRNLTILFADIRGFTSISEVFSDSPEKLTHVINAFLTGMSQVIQTSSGTIDKYIGDNIMAFWNAPAEVEDHAYAAVGATLEMKTALAKVNADLQGDPFLDGWQGEIRIGIGLNSGATLVGNIGSDQRFNYSVMGDVVNIASRLEGQTKEYGVLTLIGESTYQQATASIQAGKPDIAFLELDLIALKGKVLPERIYAVLGGTDYASTSRFQALQKAHRELLTLYRAQSWQEACAMAETLGETYDEMASFYEMLTRRIHTYQDAPPGDDWDGHYIALSK
jgi:adenylate cyclase